MNLVNHADREKRMNLRLIMNRFANVVFFLATMLGLVVLGVLIVRVLTEGLAWINMDFLTGKLSTQPERAGIMGAILGTLWLMAVVAPVTMFFGVGTAIYLELYAKKNRFNSWLETNISNLAGVPSIVYGILGMTIFVRALDFGNIILAGGFTMSLLILPIVIVASQEALRAVPGHLSEASYGMGATKWQTIRRIILPTALPGIMTGAILSLSRAIGETAPLVVIGIPALLIPFPGGIFDKFTVLPMQIYYWTLDSSLIDAYANLAAATIVTLLVILLLLNATAIMVRAKFQKQYD
ncbi:Phosphate transport system permease protein PstA [Lentibacillus sp. JNUCC-1]|uniref:phosphate ABC transporter permease PstA n=1 Tax=Lentibacillus sp. JNUCC-1 TaxID=2654513 RepID=UPI0012E927D0|nr:phosphate ABC transporter permease PstA [Lentibacillus sp. JNUCC-1]MUV38910.1 Phosphate transport system permease protein PstA [Lentibacillus sp. JNUCC-1]